MRTLRFPVRALVAAVAMLPVVVFSVDVAHAAPDPTATASSTPSPTRTVTRAPASPAAVRDLAVLGDTVRGHVGDTVDVRLTLKNTGTVPLTIIQIGAQGGWRIDFTVPEGTKAVSTTGGCGVKNSSNGPADLGPFVPGARQYRCESFDKYFAPGESSTFGFQLHITQAMARWTGTVALAMPVTGGRSSWDDRPGNDVAPIVIINTASSAGLPVTGSPVRLYAITGALLVAAGGALVLLARRRRIAGRHDATAH